VLARKRAERPQKFHTSKVKGANAIRPGCILQKESNVRSREPARLYFGGGRSAKKKSDDMLKGARPSFGKERGRKEHNGSESVCISLSGEVEAREESHRGKERTNFHIKSSPVITPSGTGGEREKGSGADLLSFKKEKRRNLEKKRKRA